MDLPCSIDAVSQHGCSRSFPPARGRWPLVRTPAGTGVRSTCPGRSAAPCRSSSAAKSRFRIVFTPRSSRTSRSSSAIRSESARPRPRPQALVNLGPAHPSPSASGFTPNCSPIRWYARVLVAGSFRTSMAIRIARSRSSLGTSFVLAQESSFRVIDVSIKPVAIQSAQEYRAVGNAPQHLDQQRRAASMQIRPSRPHRLPTWPRSWL